MYCIYKRSMGLMEKKLQTFWVFLSILSGNERRGHEES